MSYRRRASPLHAARAAAGCAYCLSLLVAALVLSAPVALGAVLLAIAGAGVGAKVGGRCAGRHCLQPASAWP